MLIICSKYKAKEKGGTHPMPPSAPFLYVNNMQEVVNKTRDKKYIAFSELVILAVDRATTVT